MGIEARRDDSLIANVRNETRLHVGTAVLLRKNRGLILLAHGGKHEDALDHLSPGRCFWKLADWRKYQFDAAFSSSG
ncbi:MAG: hypothetical protein ACLU3I_22410 [Acutalibacteraceae bacterium]